MHDVLLNVWLSQDGTQKMSKSAESDMSRINLLDDPKLLVKKIKSAKTDSGEGIQWDDPNRPEARNLITMYTLATGMSLVRYLAACSILGRVGCELLVPKFLSQQKSRWSILD